eukprot:gene29511-5860_t
MKNCGSALMHAISGYNATGIPSVTSGDQRMVYSPYDYEVKKVTKKRYIKLGSQLYSQVVKGVAPADSNVSGGRNYLDDFDPLLMIVGHHALLTGLALPPDVPHLFRLTGITKTSNQLLNTHFLDDNVSSDMHLSTVLNNLCPTDWFVPGSKISSSYCTMKDGVYSATIPIDPSQIPAFLRDGPTCLNSFAVWNKTKTAVVRGAPSIITPTGTSHTHRVRFVALLHRSSMWDGPQEPTNEELLRLALRAIILRIVAPDLLKNGIYTKAFHHGGMPDLEIQSPEGGPRGNAAEKRDREEAALGEGEQPNKLHTAREDPMEVNDQPLPTFGLPSPTLAKTPGGTPPSNTPTANLRDGDGFLKDVAAAQPIHEGYDTQYPAHIMAFAEYCQYAEEMMNNPVVQMLNVGIQPRSFRDGTINLNHTTAYALRGFIQAFPIHVTIPDCVEVFLTLEQPKAEAMERSVKIKLANQAVTRDLNHVKAAIKALSTSTTEWLTDTLKKSARRAGPNWKSQ